MGHMEQLYDASRFQIEQTWRGRAFAFLRLAAFAIIFIAANLVMHPALMPIHRHIATFEGHVLLEMSVLVLCPTNKFT